MQSVVDTGTKRNSIAKPYFRWHKAFPK